MVAKKGRVFPIIITILLIVIIIYLFASIKQPYVECSKEITNELGIQVQENIQVNLDSNSIERMDLTKTIILPNQYLNEENNYLNSMRFIIENSYEYLPKNTVKITQDSDRIISRIVVDDDETIILNNIEFTNQDDLQIRINANTKAQDVVTLSVGDSYTEEEYLTQKKNNGYSCT